MKRTLVFKEGKFIGLVWDCMSIPRIIERREFSSSEEAELWLRYGD